MSSAVVPDDLAVSARRVAPLVASAGVTALLTIGYIVYVGRMLGPARYADFAAALSIIYFAGLTLSPLTPTMGRLCARYVARADHAAIGSLRRQVLQRTGLAAVVALAIAAACTPAIARALNFRSPAVLLLSFLAVLVVAILGVDRGVVHGLLDFRVHNINTVMEAAVRLAVAAGVLEVSKTATAAVVSYVVGLAVAEIALAIQLRRQWTTSSVLPADWSEVRRLTLPITVLMFSIAVFQNSDMLAVKRFFPAQTAGAYGAAMTLARAIGVIFVPVYVMAGPLLTALHELSRPLVATTLRLTAIFLLLTCSPLLILALWSAPIVNLLYGPAFREAVPIVAPLAGVAVVTYAGLMISQALITVSEFRFLRMFMSLAAIQVVAFVLFHDTVRQILLTLYVIQGIALVLVLVYFWTITQRKSA